MKTSGGTATPSRFQRTSASTPRICGRAQIEDRLIDDAEAPRFDGAAKGLDQLEPLQPLVAERQAVRLVSVLAVALGVVHREVGLAEKRIGDAAGLRHGDTDGRRDGDVFAGDREAAAQSGEDSVARGGDLAGVVDVLEQDGELVAAEARHGVFASDGGADAAPDLDEDVVAGRVAEQVVDALEAVEVAEQHGEPAAAPLLHIDACSHAVHEQGTVREAGQRVVPRLMSHRVARG